jgi:queuosine precursor transporter
LIRRRRAADHFEAVRLQSAVAKPDGAIPITATAPAPRSYKYYDLIMAAFVTVMLCSNLVTAPKQTNFLGQVFGAGVIFFPITYIFGDILTEVYGYARSRRVVWAGFAASVFGAVVAYVTISLPPDPDWAVRNGIDNQRAMETVFGGTWRIVLGSLTGFLCGEFANSFVMARMKVWSNGQRLWMRTIASTIVGELFDSAIFLHVAFAGNPSWPESRILRVLATNYVLKVGNEVLMTPVTYAVVGFLKRAENEDYYDRDTNFTPFKLDV